MDKSQVEFRNALLKASVVRERRKVYHSAMPYEDDIAFQRAILANPADTTLKLVYADWLQDRADPRTEFVRLQAQLHEWHAPDSAPHISEWLGRNRTGLDQKWVAFMTTLAQLFVPILVINEEFGSPPPLPRPYPFTEPIGRRGRIVTFQSLFSAATDWNDGLLTDLAFLTSVEWGTCAAGFDKRPISGFLCELKTKSEPLDKADISAALKVTRRVRITRRADVTAFGDGEDFAAEKPAHGELKRHVVDGELWYADLAWYIPTPAGGPYSPSLSVALGRSPNGERLVGAIAVAHRHVSN